jgi:predicted PhzF superfamily epimerase YddE/YHI9
VLPFEPKAVVASNGEDLMVVTTEQNVRDFNGSFAHLDGDRGIVLTAQGVGEYDLVSRFFGFKHLGIDEDPVTGSAHCLIVPYWAKTLGRQEFRCLQASKRQGVLMCQLRGERVILFGTAVTFAKAEIYLSSL